MALCYNNLLSKVGSLTGIIGALLVASNSGLGLAGYMLFATSSITWIIYSHRTKQKDLLQMNIVFGLINVLGLINFA